MFADNKTIMATVFAHSGAILDDKLTGFSQVVNQLDEGAVGTTKDLVLVTGATTIDAHDHHGKTLEVREAAGASVTLTLPKDGDSDYPPVGFKCTVVLGKDNASGTESLIVQAGDTVSKIVGAINGSSNGNDKTKATVAASAKAYETEITCEAVYDGTSYFWKMHGTSVATVTFST